MNGKVYVRKRKTVKNGIVYEYRFEVESIDGKRKWISKSGFKTLSMARKAGIEALEDYCMFGRVVEPVNMSFADFLEHWINIECESTLNEVTVMNYRKKVKNLINPYLGRYNINTINRDKLQNLLSTLHNNGYARNTLLVVKGILTKCFNYAVISDYLIKSPAHNLRIPKNKNTKVPTRKAPHIYLTNEQLNKIFDRFPVSSSAHLPLMLGLHCGLRLGEVFALTWDDVDLDNKKISVNKQIQWRQYPRTEEDKKENNGKATSNSGCWYFTSTKYNSDRIIEIDNELYKLLVWKKRKHKKENIYYYETPKREISTTPSGKKVHFICVREDGTYVSPRTMQHTSSVIHKQLGIENFDFHSLRHTHATVLLENNAPLKYIQQRLGHKKLDITLNVYQHLTENLIQKGIESLNSIYISK